MEKLFDDNRNYLPTDPEIIEIMGDRDRQGQLRHRGTSPAYYRFGQKIIYRGTDLNVWAEANRINQAA